MGRRIFFGLAIFSFIAYIGVGICTLRFAMHFHNHKTTDKIDNRLYGIDTSIKDLTKQQSQLTNRVNELINEIMQDRNERAKPK